MQRFPVKRLALLKHAKKITEEQGVVTDKNGCNFIRFAGKWEEKGVVMTVVNQKSGLF
jgi:hypothetical protein